MFKKILSLIICAFLICSPFSLSASAAVVEKGKITIGTVNGIIGDSVIVPINIEENPGISAITVSITYDSSALEFEEYIKGNVLASPEAVAHPSRNIIRFVTSEMGNKFSDGTLISFKFKIKPNIEDKLYQIGMKFNSGDFCNWKLDKIMPTVVSGGVKVDYTEETCPHKNYSEWTVAAAPSCQEQGMDSRICKKCGHTDLRYNEPIGHEYSDIWTVDREATAEKDGLMSRHCIRCSDFVDQISFKYEQIDDGKIENNYGDQTQGNDFIEDIFKEQNPDKELTPNIPPKDPFDQDENANSSKPTQSSPNSISSDTQSSNNESTIQQDETTDSSDTLTIGPIDNTDNETYFDKILAVIPNAEKILSAFKTAIIILLVFIIL